jgi:hypothetical protein
MICIPSFSLIVSLSPVDSSITTLGLALNLRGPGATDKELAEVAEDNEFADEAQLSSASVVSGGAGKTQPVHSSGSLLPPTGGNNVGTQLALDISIVNQFLNKKNYYETEYILIYRLHNRLIFQRLLKQITFQR